MRSILLRTLNPTILRFTPKYLFNQTAPPQKKNIFKLPLKHDYPTEALQATTQYILSARSCNVLAVTFRDNISLFTEQHLSELYLHLWDYKLEIDNSFHQIIAPISLQYLKVFNREHATTMYTMIMTMLQLQIENKELWNALINKLDNENCYRYISLHHSAHLLNELLSHPEHSQLSLTRKLIGVVHQQKLWFGHNAVDTFNQIRSKLENLQSKDPQLTEAYAQLK